MDSGVRLNSYPILVTYYLYDLGHVPLTQIPPLQNGVKIIPSVVMRLKYFIVFKVPLTVGLGKHYFLVKLKSALKRDGWWVDVVCNFKRSFLL